MGGILTPIFSPGGGIFTFFFEMKVKIPGVARGDPPRLDFDKRITILYNYSWAGGVMAHDTVRGGGVQKYTI